MTDQPQGLRDRWQALPPYARAAVGGLAFGVGVGLVTSNPLAGAGVGLLCGGLGFYWSAAPFRGMLAASAVFGCVAWLFLSAVIFTAAPISDPSVEGGWRPGYYACGRVITHPFTNPTASWRTEDQSQIAQRASSPGSTFVVDDCASKFRGYRISGFVVAALAVICGLASRLPTRKRTT